MKNRLVLVINPRSSGYSLVHEKIVRNIQKLNLAENQQITYEIQPTNPLENAEKRHFKEKNIEASKQMQKKSNENNEHR